MSAFIVGHDHIDALMTFAVYGRVSYWSPPARQRIDITPRNAEEVGRILLHENERSVRHRYPTTGADKLPGTIGEDDASYRFRPFARPLTALTIIKAVRCLAYQSCEHPDWFGSLAWHVCDAITTHAIHNLPGFSDAPGWQITRERARA